MTLAELQNVMETRRASSSAWGEGQVRSDTFQEEGSVGKCREVGAA